DAGQRPARKGGAAPPPSGGDQSAPGGQAVAPLQTLRCVCAVARPFFAERASRAKDRVREMRRLRKASRAAVTGRKLLKIRTANISRSRRRVTRRARTLPGFTVAARPAPHRAFVVVDGMVVLGEIIDSQGSTSASIDFWLSEAESYFWADSRALCAPATVQDKMRAWCRGPRASALHGTETWHVTADLMHKLRSWEFKFLRRAFRLRRKPAETYQDDLQIKASRIEGRMARAGFQSIHIVVLGYVCKAANYEPAACNDEGMSPLCLARADMVHAMDQEGVTLSRVATFPSQEAVVNPVLLIHGRMRQLCWVRRLLMLRLVVMLLETPLQLGLAHAEGHSIVEVACRGAFDEPKLLWNSAVAARLGLDARPITEDIKRAFASLDASAWLWPWQMGATMEAARPTVQQFWHAAAAWARADERSRCFPAMGDFNVSKCQTLPMRAPKYQQLLARSRPHGLEWLRAWDFMTRAAFLARDILPSLPLASARQGAEDVCRLALRSAARAIWRQGASPASELLNPSAIVRRFLRDDERGVDSPLKAGACRDSASRLNCEWNGRQRRAAAERLRAGPPSALPEWRVSSGARASRGCGEAAEAQTLGLAVRLRLLRRGPDWRCLELSTWARENGIRRRRLRGGVYARDAEGDVHEFTADALAAIASSVDA
ncbi:unnamed protein product, partial [Prorocentrum cordatum]